MKTIWKYELTPDCTIDIPCGAEISSVAAQGEDICLWAVVDPENKYEQRRFIAVGTGHIVPDLPLDFVGTAFLYGGKLVFHIFEVREA